MILKQKLIILKLCYKTNKIMNNKYYNYWHSIYKYKKNNNKV